MSTHETPIAIFSSQIAYGRLQGKHAIKSLADPSQLKISAVAFRNWVLRARTHRAIGQARSVNLTRSVAIKPLKLLQMKHNALAAK
jgi:hypothetical protein